MFKNHDFLQYFRYFNISKLYLINVQYFLQRGPPVLHLLSIFHISPEVTIQTSF